MSGDHTAALLATLVHTAAYLAVAGALAWVVYARLGLRFLRSAWINMNVVWAAALILAAVATAAHGQGKAGAGAWRFVNARYDTRSPASLYAGYGRGPAIAMGAVELAAAKGARTSIGTGLQLRLRLPGAVVGATRCAR